MTDKEKLNHCCKDVCSGWQDGYEKGFEQGIEMENIIWFWKESKSFMGYEKRNLRGELNYWLCFPGALYKYLKMMRKYSRKTKTN